MINQALLKELGDIVRFHRKAQKLNRLELARLAHIGKTAIFDIEHYKTTVQLNTLFQVLDALNIQVQLNSPLMEAYCSSN